MGVVFDRSCGVDPPIYLFARVVRYQTEPIAGLGLRWIKATTAMEPRLLATFLELLFGVSASRLLAYVAEGQGRMRSSFEFEGFLRDVVERRRPEPREAAEGELRSLPPPRTNLRDPEAGPIGLITRPEEVDALKIELVPHAQGHTGPLAAVTHDDVDGLVAPARKSPAAAPAPAPGPTPPSNPLPDRPVPADLAATLEVGSESLQVRITEFSRSALFVRTLVGPVDIDGVYPLRFSIATREGGATLAATTRISEVRTGRNDGTPGLELEIVDLDEGGRSGLLARYVRWLQSTHPGRA